MIVKNLNQVYFICSTYIFYFFLRLLRIIFSLTLLDKDEYLKIKIYEILAEFFSIIGIIFYLELIELNFCGISHVLKKNIRFRSLDDLDISKAINDNENEERVSELSDL